MYEIFLEMKNVEEYKNKTKRQRILLLKEMQYNISSVHTKYYFIS
jgi:hypothetical protein